jgi:hypothetical protein
MEDGLELSPGFRVAENALRQNPTFQSATPIENSFSEDVLDINQRGLIGFNQLPREDIGVDDRDSLLAQQIGCRRFAHSNATRQPYAFQFKSPRGPSIRSRHRAVIAGGD